MKFLSEGPVLAIDTDSPILLSVGRIKKLNQRDAMERNITGAQTYAALLHLGFQVFIYDGKPWTTFEPNENNCRPPKDFKWKFRDDFIRRLKHNWVLNSWVAKALGRFEEYLYTPEEMQYLF
jgi:hypothetical protein